MAPGRRRNGTRYQDVPTEDASRGNGAADPSSSYDSDSDSASDIERNNRRDDDSQSNTGTGSGSESDDDGRSTESESLIDRNRRRNDDRVRFRRQRTRNLIQRETQGSTFMLLLTWMLVFFCLAAAVLGLLGYRYYSKPSHNLPNVKGWFQGLKSKARDTDQVQKINGHEASPPVGSSPAKPLNVGQGDQADASNETDDPYSHPNAKHVHEIHYNPNAVLPSFDPFGFDSDSSARYAANLVPNALFEGYGVDDQQNDVNMLGYLRQPSAHNGTIVFLSEGDLYLTRLPPASSGPVSRMDAVKLTTTAGNVLTPHINPVYPYYVAFTATYSGRRELYLLDLRGPRTPALRLTYWDAGYGVSAVSGWAPDGKSIFIRALSNDVSLPDYRLYRVHLSMSPATPLQITPVPLSQAMEGTMVGSCMYFVRVKQSSHTIRYVGGTAENLWMYCDDEAGFQPDAESYRLAVPLLQDGYPGTSKSPQLYRTDEGKPFLFFLFDRALRDDGTDRMNVWALSIDDGTSSELVRITDTACDFEGRTVQEFTVDSVTGNVVVRIGADLYQIEASVIRGRLNQRRHLEEDVDEESESEEESEDEGESIDDESENEEGESEDEVESEEESIDDERENEEGEDPHSESNEDEITAGKAGEEGQGDERDGTEMSTNSEIVNNPGITIANESVHPEIATETESGVPPKADDEEESASTESTSDTESSTVSEGSSTGDSTQAPATSSQAFVDNVGETTTETEAITANISNSENQAESVSDNSEGDDSNVESEETKPLDITVEPKDHESAVQELETSHTQQTMSSMRTAKAAVDHHSGHSQDLKRLPIIVHSDFSEHQERVIPLQISKHLTAVDVYDTAVGTTHSLLSLRGQLWVAPVIDEGAPFEGGGMNLPDRRYRVGPGAMMGGSTRIITAKHVPNPLEDAISDRRLAIVLATDPLSPTAEQAFYLTEVQSDATPLFVDSDKLPTPFLGGHVSGGSTKVGGLGSVRADSVAVSPCGRRMAWTDTDGRIAVMALPQYQNMTKGKPANYTLLPKENELGEAMIGDEVDLVWSPGGRYLAVNHNARNKFQVISIVDCGEPYNEDAGIVDISIGRIVQATSDRFNSVSMLWGKSPSDRHKFKQSASMAGILGEDPPKDVPATMFYYLSDRDVINDVASPWGTRQTMPHFPKLRDLYGIPLKPKNVDADKVMGHFTGGGAAEVAVDKVLERKRAATIAAAKKGGPGRKLLGSLANGFKKLSGKRRRAQVEPKDEAKELLAEKVDAQAIKEEMKEPLEKMNVDPSASFPTDAEIDFGPADLSFSRQAYRVVGVPTAQYTDLISQTTDDGSFLIIEQAGANNMPHLFIAEDYPSDGYKSMPLNLPIDKCGRSTSSEYVYVGFAGKETLKAVPNTVVGLSSLFSDPGLESDIVDTEGLQISIWPSLEYQQMYGDAWRMLRDYFYDPDMASVDWPMVFERYRPLVSRCTKREELDDVLAQMAAEVSALHVFVYGGEYNSPTHGDKELVKANEISSLGAVLQRSSEWNGYKVMSIPERDPDFDIVDGNPIYSPLSDQMLRVSGQRGLQVGDVIVGVNGESVMRVPNIHMLLRGKSGRSVRLEVLRLASGETKDSEGGDDGTRTVEPLITVPITPDQSDNLRYSAWEWKTRETAKKLAKDAGFSLGYLHMRDMSGMEAEDAFVRGFFPDFNKQAMIIDVRHNRGGNIDSWVIDVIQRRVWTYWQSRDFDINNGGMGWDGQYAFRGHLVVLIDEKTSSDSEGLSRGISELGLGKLIGTRTWGGGIWLSSDNELVDGGIATAPEIGTYNEKLGWGTGVEMTGVSPDIEVDNNPRSTFAGKDEQLERAILELKDWLKREPVVFPKPPEKRPNMSLGERECRAST